MESSNNNIQEDEQDLFIIKKLEINPEISSIAEAVEFNLTFSLSKPINSPIQWKVNYIIDYTGKRVINELYESPRMIYEGTGEQIVNIKTPEIAQVEKVPRKTLLNVGLLQIKAFQVVENGELDEVLSLNMVVHVSKDKQDETKLLKTVLNPID